MPFRLSCAPAIFQRIIEQTVADIPDVACYLDDIIITGKTEKDHIRSKSPKDLGMAQRQWIPTAQE